VLDRPLNLSQHAGAAGKEFEMKHLIALTPVDSSQIHSIGHDAATNTLAIRFKNYRGDLGSLYHYDNFTAEDFAAFKGAKSIGSHFGKNIKNEVTKYPFRKIEETEEATGEIPITQASRFDTSVTGLTTDTTTGLTWSRGYAVPGEITFADAEAAISFINGKSFGGFSDWRLPTVQELFGLVDHTRHSPAIDTDAFESGAYEWVWTSTPYAASSSDGVWIVGFSDGYVDYNRRGHYAFVRAVRGPSPAGQ
jgi:hypothetical protein